MQHAMTQTDITLTATFDELATWESNGLAVYATPAADDHAYAVQIYVSSRPNFAYDYCIATVQDFEEAEGLDTLGWQEMSEEEYEEHKDETLSAIVPRTKTNRW